MFGWSKAEKEEEELRKTLEQANKLDAQAAEQARACPPMITIERYAAGEFLVYDNRHHPKLAQWPSQLSVLEGKLHEIPRRLIVGMEYFSHGRGPSIASYSDDSPHKYVAGRPRRGYRSIWLAHQVTMMAL
ncbi:hypothetical protein DBIPINDM_008209 (plasmid) [Mesorhizobium sp. AR02]|uniref:hypothetical protein n=1 Tax=Mesorhizobium sp. AR02 TaxID=2865837 RepID=UPI00215FD482|nr:hypothetical protein [Mesorhizobium sp. AR02]UVK57597.1 hypothetical protein DBIPINDM_008209 [Mesorhizobium sp. AR02]